MFSQVPKGRINLGKQISCQFTHCYGNREIRFLIKTEGGWKSKRQNTNKKTKNQNPTGLDAEGTGQVSLLAAASKLPSVRAASAGEGVSARRRSYRHPLPWKQVSTRQRARVGIYHQPRGRGRAGIPVLKMSELKLQGVRTQLQAV